MELPTEKSVPKPDIKDYVLLIYGKPKIGKTSLAAQFDDPLFLMFEPGSKAMSLYQQEIKTWKEFKEVIDLIKKEKQFKTIVLDTVDAAYELAMEYSCNQLGIDHPQDAPYGKGWNTVDREFSTTMSRLAMLHRGIILLSHAKEKDVEQSDGSVQEMVGPSLANQGMKWADRNADLFAYYFYGKGNKRLIQVKGSNSVVAGSRIDGHFIGIDKFDAGEHPSETYKNFIDAFNNKITQEDSNVKTHWFQKQSSKSHKLLPNGESSTALEGSQRRSIKIRPRG